MSVNDLRGIIPFSELSERVMTLAKTDSFNYRDFIRGLVNDCYTRDLPRTWDWDPIIAESAFLTSAPYTTGSCAIAVGSTALVGTGTTWTNTMTAVNGWRIKFSGNDNIYNFTYASATTATISPALSGIQNLTGSGYTLWQEEVQLADDFDRLLRNGSVYTYSGGRLQTEPLEESPRDQFRQDYVPSPADPIKRIMLTGTHATTGAQLLRINPPPATSKLYPYEYIKKIAPMFEYTTGTVSLTSGSTTVTGTGTTWTTNLSAGMYFRVDSIGISDSSKWYRIASITSNTSLELTSAYLDPTTFDEPYTACTAPTAFPAKFHQFIMYDVALKILSSQDDPSVKSFAVMRNDVLNGLNKDYRGRRTNTQFRVDDDGYRR